MVNPQIFGPVLGLSFTIMKTFSWRYKTEHKALRELLVWLNIKCWVIESDYIQHLDWSFWIIFSLLLSWTFCCTILFGVPMAQDPVHPNPSINWPTEIFNCFSGQDVKNVESFRGFACNLEDERSQAGALRVAFASISLDTVALLIFDIIILVMTNTWPRSQNCDLVLVIYITILF